MPASSAFSTPLRTSIGAGRLRFRNGNYLDSENTAGHSAGRKLSEMINPDGSITVRRRVAHPDGSRSIVQEEYASMDQRILGKYDDLRYEECSVADPPSLEPSSPGSQSTLHSVPTVSRDRSFESYDQSSEGSTFSVHWNKPLSYEDIEKNRVQGRTQILQQLRGSSPITHQSHADGSSWGFNDADISAISGDSIGYPMLDAGSKIQAPHQGEQNDDSSEWSLLHDDNDEAEKATSRTVNTAPSRAPGKPPLPQKGKVDGNISRTSSQILQSRTMEHPSQAKRASHTKPAASAPSWDGDKSRSDRVVLKQADTLAKPQVKYYSDPGIATRPTTVRDNNEAILDSHSLHSNQNGLYNTISETISTEEIAYTVRKSTPDDLLGIFVSIRDLASGPKLVVSRVQPGGKFAESPIEKGDIVASINGVNFLRYPNAQEALEIVRDARDKVTFVVLKNKETPDTSSDDDFSLPSLPYANVNLVDNPDGSRVKTREVANHDGSQTIIDEFFDRDGRKRKQTMRRRWLGFDGSTRDVSFSSLDVNGEMMLWVRKTMQTEIVGLRLENRRTHRGQNAIVVSQVFPSGLFARTPLSVGDIVVSINDVDFRFNPDIRKASEVMAKSNNAVMVMATKPSEWIEKRQQRISQSRQLVETFTIDPPRSKAYQFDASAYDDSVFGYNSTKKVSLKDFSASERLGVIIVSQYTRLGVLLVAKEVSSSGRLAALGLRNGDVILSINGVDMKREPDASRAMSLIRNSEKGIEIEYQRLQNLIEKEGIKNIPVDRMESFRPDGTKSIRTETRNPDGSVLVRIEEVGPANPVDTALTNLGSGKDASPDISRISSDTSRGLPRNSSSFEAIATSTSFGQQRSLEPVYVQVNKSKRFQNVGIDLVVANGALCVARVSKGGLLFGKPIIPGDTVLEINGQDFRTNPSARRAHSVLLKATTSVSFTIVRTSLLKGMHGEKGLRPSRKKVSLNCFSREKR